MAYDALKLENQLCFPLYACAREVVKKYKPHLEKIGLTYTQYIAMMAMWEHKSLNVKALGEYLHLDSGTLTPLLKKLAAMGLVARARSEKDERNLIVSVTPKGEALKKEAAGIPQRMAACLPLQPEEAAQLYGLLYKVLSAE